MFFIHEDLITRFIHEAIRDGCYSRRLSRSLDKTNLLIKSIKCVAYTNDIFKEEKKHYVTLFVASEYDSGELQIKEPDECEKWDWFHWNEFPDPLFLSLRNLLDEGFNL